LVLSPKLTLPPKLQQVGYSIVRAIVAIMTIFVANLAILFFAIQITPTWTYQAPTYYWLMVIGANFGGALVPGYFSLTKKAARNMGLILGLSWGLIAGLVLWYFGIFLGVAIFSGVLVGYNYIRGETTETHSNLNLGEQEY